MRFMITLVTLQNVNFRDFMWLQTRITPKIHVLRYKCSSLLNTIIYARRHKNQIQALQIQEIVENGEMANFARHIRCAVGVFYVYLVFLVCYLPFFISVVAVLINGPSISLKKFSLFSWTLLFLNSSLNPLIYCWKKKHIRHAIMDILRNMPWFRNRGTR